MYNDIITLFFGANYEPNELELTFVILFFFLALHVFCGLIGGLIKAVR